MEQILELLNSKNINILKGTNPSNALVNAFNSAIKLSSSYWDEGQPDNWDVRVNGEDCGQLHARIRADKRRFWNDADCTLSYPYICESKPKSQ